MPFVGLGVHVLIALFFAVHAIRTGRNMYWLLILFSFPLLGSVVYFLVEFLPQSRLQRGVNRATGVAMKLLDPEREYRDALTAFDLTPTAQNKIRLASASLERGRATEAVGHYRDALKGPFANDAELLFGHMRALLEEGTAPGAREALDTAARLKSAHPDYRKQEVALLIARAYAGAGDDAEAGRAFEFALQAYNDVETRARYIAWLASRGAREQARGHFDDLAKAARHWNPHARSLNREWMALAESSLKP
jgi:hypothetical protein